jgi:hypothetical protein
VARELARFAAPDSDADRHADAVNRACVLVVQNLCESMGDDGCRALFGRAFARSATLDPVIIELRDGPEPMPSPARVSAAIQAHGAGAVQAAVEMLLATLIDILARLIGEDMAIRIIDRDPPPRDSSGGQP